MNRYIKAMEIGLAHEKEGITYFNLLDKLNASMGEKMNVGAEKTFVIWFTENFSSDNFKISNGDIRTYFGTYTRYRDGALLHDSAENKAKTVEGLLKKLHWLDGQAAKQYLDYQELVESRQTAQEAREASREANKKADKSIRLAIWAIVVSAAVGISSIIVDLVAPKPPYDVKVIENTPIIDSLEKENNQLTVELHKVQMILDSLLRESPTKNTK